MPHGHHDLCTYIGGSESVLSHIGSLVEDLGNVSADYGKIMTRKKKIVRKLVSACSVQLQYPVLSDSLSA